MWQGVRFAAVAVIAVGGLAACEPPPPPVVFEVNSVATSRDVNPGDGVCETALGNGECTVAAAIDEGNAAGRAVVHLPGPDVGAPEPLSDPVSITGDLTLVGESQNDWNARFEEVQVLPGSILRLEDAVVMADRVVVEGTLLVDRTWIIGRSTIDTSGRMLALNTVLSVDEYPGAPPIVENHGFFWMRYGYLIKDAPAIHTAHGATSRFGASVFYSDEVGLCTGAAVESDGYNWDGVECVSGPTDQPQGPFSYSIPLGVLGCGTDVVVDLDGDPRPRPDADPVGCTPGSNE